MVKGTVVPASSSLSFFFFSLLSCFLLLVSHLPYRACGQGAAPIPVLVPCHAGDQAFLLQFKRALVNGDAKLADWSDDSSCCAWPGIMCARNSTTARAQQQQDEQQQQQDEQQQQQGQRVERLSLPGLGLNGSISDLPWANLSALQSLDLSFNQLTGPLPPGLAQLRALQVLSLATNSFWGELDVLAAGFPSLEHLDLSNNTLSGALPVALPIPGLMVLDLSGNLLGGPWPGGGLRDMPRLRLLNVSHNVVNDTVPRLPNCSALVELDLSYNAFGGPLDTAVCLHKPHLRLLNLSDNQINGTVPAAIAGCARLEVLDLSSNQLGGQLPPELMTTLRNLTTLGLANNALVGSLDPAVANLRSLRRLQLSTNHFTGPIPAGIGMLRALERLDLSFNNFSGGLPPELLLNCTRLTSLSVRRNNLSGAIDHLAFDNLPALSMLDLAFNFFVGGFPASISGCSELVSLTLSGNSLTGPIPPELGRLKKLVTLSLSTNNLTGGIPPELTGCTSLVSLLLTKNSYLGAAAAGVEAAAAAPVSLPNLQLLALGVCGFQGGIPDWIGGCSKLQLLDLSWNEFVGPMPGWISTLQHLIYLDLSNNSLSGVLPVNLSMSPSFSGQPVDATGLVEVTSLVLFVTRNVSLMPQRYTRLSGFPPSLILANNQFYGAIPPEYGKLQKVMALDVSHNRLSGHIPDTLSNMSSLYSLNLADNALSGGIPPSFSALTFLALFDVSNNNLSGPIPDGTQFSGFPETSFLNNPLLCGAPLPNKCGGGGAGSPGVLPLDGDLHPGGAGPERVKGMSRKAILGLTIGAGLAMALVLGFFTRCVMFRRRRLHDDRDAARCRPPPKDGGGDDDDDDASSAAGMVSFSVDLYLNHQLAKLSPADLVKATNNFDQSQIIGCGGFGLVFRATLSDGSHLAIKRLSGDTGQAEREVQAELLTLGQIQHRNLVSLQGYCRFGADRLLIYNYMENGSLDYWLHERADGGATLDWPLRRRIAQGAARGLAYLHQHCQPHIVHRDIKTSNILLNDKFEAHLADFGLARHLASNNDTHVTTELVGTLGYIPPEYGQAWIATLRGDVYSFGVVVLELLTRRRPVEVSRAKGVADLVSWVHDMRAKGTPEELLDVLLRHQGYEKEILQVLEVAVMCVSHNPQKRPAIHEVVYMLEQVGGGGGPADGDQQPPPAAAAAAVNVNGSGGGGAAGSKDSAPSPPGPALSSSVQWWGAGTAGIRHLYGRKRSPAGSRAASPSSHFFYDQRVDGSAAMAANAAATAAAA